MRQNLEQLEGRQLFCGTISHHTLYITGTAGKDSITITQRSDKTVLINGDGKSFKVAAGSFNKLSIDLGKGDDYVMLQNLTLSQGGAILTGDGRDTVGVTGCTISNGFLIDTGAHNDFVAATYNVISGLVVKTGAGNDLVRSYANKLSGYSVFSTGDGLDSLAIAKTATYGYSTIDLGKDADALVNYKNTFGGPVSILNVEQKFDY